jgi:predicted permease
MKDSIRLDPSQAGASEKPLEITFVSGNYLAVLGGRAAAGRTLAASDDRPGAEPVVVISHAFWKQRFHSDASIVGRKLRLGNGFATVAGIVRPGFTGPDDQPGVLWAPFATYGALYGGAAIDPSSRAQVRVIARMPAGASASAASDELTSVARSLPPAGFEGSSTAPEKTTGVRIERASRIEGPDAMGVYIVMAVLFVVLGLVLALACANVANLLLAGASTRAREFGVRIAMGASRPRLMRQLLSESLVIGAAAGAAGLLLSMWAVPLITRLVGLPMSSDVTLDRSVLLFTTLIAALSGVGAGLAPARYGSRSDVAGILKAQSLQAGASPQASRLRRGFIAFQAAASMLLLVTATLFFRSALHITQVDLGFDADRLIAVHVDFPTGGSAGESARIAAYFRTAVERVSAVPSVEGVSLALSPPFGPVAITNLKRNGTDYIIVNNRTDADYFRTAGFRIIRGRGYTHEEVASVAPVALVSESLTREFYQGIEPIGASLAPVMVKGGEEITIVGVVADALVTHVRGGGGTTYRPIGPDPYATPQLIVRSSEPDHAIRDVETALAPIDPSVRLSSTLMRESVTKFMNEPRVLAGLSGAVALLSLILSVLGIFGVTSFVVGQRTQEVSVRMAIGASAGDVVRLLIRQNMWPVVGGLVAGLAVALLGARVFTAQLFGISPYDPLAIVPAVVVLAGTALAAVAIPALRAARTDPASVLRQ